MRIDELKTKILGLVEEKPGLSQSEIARELGYNNLSYVSQVVKILEAEGKVTTVYEQRDYYTVKIVKPKEDWLRC